MGERTKVPRRPMTHDERVLALYLGRLSYPVASFSKRFGREIAAQASADEPTITERQAAQMQRQAWTYRRQLLAKDLGRLVPASRPPPPAPRETPPPRAPRRQVRRPSSDLQVEFAWEGT